MMIGAARPIVVEPVVTAIKVVPIIISAIDSKRPAAAGAVGVPPITIAPSGRTK